MLHGQLRYNVASRFLDEVPAGMLQWLSPRHANFAAEPEAFAGRNAAERIRDGAGWRIGQSVKHSRFGLGIIIDAEGRGTDARVQVNFRDGGVKWLALEYAKLQPA
jgi:DNA helicase-2/ATP-dependent DNA helicase PcrA